MPHSHHKQLAGSPSELSVRGNYLQVQICQVALRATVKQYDYSDEIQQLTLLEAIYSNLWEHRLKANSETPLLIDSDGFQHSAKYLGDEAFVKKSPRMKRGIRVPPVADVIEGSAKSRGWIAFEELKSSVVPHRLIFRTNIFSPGETSGYVEHSETLELIFDLSVFSHLLKDKTST